MTAYTPISKYDRVSFATHSYSMNEGDFPEGCFTRTDILTGRTWGYGRNKLGLAVSVPLDTPLCVGCDSPITQGLCTSCELEFVGERS